MHGSFFRANKTDSQSATDTFNEEKDDAKKLNPEVIDHFFDKIYDFILNEKKLKKQPKVWFFLVLHVAASLPHFIKIIEKIGGIALIIPKHTHHTNPILASIKKTHSEQLFSAENPKFEKYFKNKSPVEIGYREIIEKIAINIISDCAFSFGPEEKFVIIDIGGNLSFSLPEIYRIFPEQFLGLVEDTENGHQRLLKVLEELIKKKLICTDLASAARDKLKAAEDYKVGRTLVDATIKLLEQDGKTLKNIGRIGILGYGKIGQSIAAYLRQKGIIPYIYDKNPQIQVLIRAHEFNVTQHDELLETCMLIFCATGNKAITNFEFYDLQDGVYLSLCTSADDELDLTELKISGTSNEEKISSHKSITKYILDSKLINLLANGNAVNFATGDADDNEYVYSVLATLLVASVNLINEQPKPTDKITTIPEDDANSIARIWLNIFENISFENIYKISNRASLYRLFIKPETESISKVLCYLDFTVDLLSNHDRVKNKELIKFLLNLALHTIKEPPNNNNTNNNSENNHKIYSDIPKKFEKIKKSAEFINMFNDNEIFSGFKTYGELQTSRFSIIRNYYNIDYLKYFIFFLCDQHFLTLDETNSQKTSLSIYWLLLYHNLKIKDDQKIKNPKLWFDHCCNLIVNENIYDLSNIIKSQKLETAAEELIKAIEKNRIDCHSSDPITEKLLSSLKNSFDICNQTNIIYNA